MDAIIETAAPLAGVPCNHGALDNFFQLFETAQRANPGQISDAIAAVRKERKTQAMPFEKLRLAEWLKNYGASIAEKAQQLATLVGAPSISAVVLTLYRSPESLKECARMLR
jgi:hypothetical protein